VKAGDRVEIQRAGDVIPQVLRVVESGKGAPFEFPSSCPICSAAVSADVDEKTGKQDVVRRCTNGLSCPAQGVQALIHFVSRQVFDIDGFGEKQVEAFFEKDLIKAWHSSCGADKFSSDFSTFHELGKILGSGAEAARL